jgi:hypothetical protein
MVRIEAISEWPTIKIDRTPAVHDQSQAIDAAWECLCEKNPRYFNGEILVFDSHDQTSGILRASVEQYKNHAVRDKVDIGISLLATTAVLMAVDREQMKVVYLVGKRSTELHQYGGLWELGPSGGVDVPPAGDSMNPHRILDELAREICEEIGVETHHEPREFLTIVHDDAAGSTDIVITTVFDPVPDLKSNWEYSQTRWVTFKELLNWTESNPEEFIPTTVAIVQHIHQNGTRRC